MKNMLKVAKFGGSSVADAEQFAKVKNIVLSDSMRKYVVISASGKKGSNENKITDLLYLCFAHIKYSVNCENVWSMIEERFLTIKKELNLHYPIEDELNKIKSQLIKGISEDYLVSRGEYLTALLMAEYLGYNFIDAKDVIKFDYSGKIDFNRSYDALMEATKDGTQFVIPGFYGSLPNGEIKTLTRGGSDITGAIIAKLINAALYENWTDVSGILIADPRIVKEPKQIKYITYEELRELSYMGANVLHEEAIFPVMEANIPLHILNTNDPINEGTIIVESDDNEKAAITGVAGKKNFSVITIYKKHMSDEVGIVRKALSVMEKYGVSIEHIPSGIDSFSIVVETEQIKNAKYDIVVDIKDETNADSVKVIDDIALIAVVGVNMVNQVGISGRLFNVLGQNNINIRMIAQGSDEITIIIGVENKDFDGAIQAIYKEFVD